MTHFIHREADYAIRIVAYLAGKKEKIKIKEVSEKLYLSKPTVIKIVHKLRKCGIIITETGKNGGIRVSPKIVDLTLYDVLICMGFNSSINICVDRPDECELNPICNITYFFSNIQNQIIDQLKKAKVKDFIFEDKGVETLY